MNHKSDCAIADSLIPATQEYVWQIGRKVNRLFEAFMKKIVIPDVLSDGNYEIGTTDYIKVVEPEIINLDE